MKRRLHLLFIPLLLLMSLPVMADEVSIMLNEQGYINAEDVSTITQGAITVTFDKAEGNNGPKYYDSGSAVRFYGGNTMTVTSSGDAITDIILECVDKKYPTSETFLADPEGQSTTGATTEWKGSANTVVITHNAPKDHWRIQKITIITGGGGGGDDTLTEITSIASLRELQNGTKVRLTLGRDNQGNIEWVDDSDDTKAYVRDNTGAVMFSNFLPDDAGWHTHDNGALIGSVDGEYNFTNGMPTFTHISSSIADSILCLDNWQYPEPMEVSDLSILQGETYRADYVVVNGVSLTYDNYGLYTILSGDKELHMSNKFGVSDIIPNDLKGRVFRVYGILGATADGSSSELYYTQIDELIPEVTLGETLYTNVSTIGTYDNRDVDVIVNRQLITNTWNTLCLPFDISDFSSIVSASRLAELTGYDPETNTLEFSSVEDLKAGVPYLVYPEEDVDKIVINGATIRNDLSPVTLSTYEMVGIYDPTTLYAGDTSILFLGTDNTLYYPNVTNDLKGFRAYFRTTSEAPANICIDGVTSNIRIAEMTETNGTDRIYNVSGQFVGTSTSGLKKGVYVTRGNKVIIK